MYCLTIPVEWLNAVKPCGTSSLFRSLTKLKNVLLVSTTQLQTNDMSMRCHNLYDYIVAHSEEHFPHSLEIESNHEKAMMFFYTQIPVLPLFLVWILLLVSPQIRILQVNSLECFSPKFLTNGYTYSHACSSYTKSNSTKSFQSLWFFPSFPSPHLTSAQSIH